MKNCNFRRSKHADHRRHAQSAQEEVQIAPSTEGNMPLAITKEIKSIKKDTCRERSRRCVCH